MTPARRSGTPRSTPPTCSLQLPGLNALRLGPAHEPVDIPGEVDVTATFTGRRLDALVVDLGDLGSVELTLSGQGEPVSITAPSGDVTDLADSGWFASAPDQPGG